MCIFVILFGKIDICKWSNDDVDNDNDDDDDDDTVFDGSSWKHAIIDT